MTRRITGASLILLAACAGGTTRVGGGKALSYAQYCSLERGMQAAAILEAFGPPAHVLTEEGKVRGVAYACDDGSGKVREVRMVFSPEERLREWVLRDPKAPPATAARAAP